MPKSDPDIALFVSSLDGGGAHKMMIQIAKGLSKLGRDVDLVVIKKRGPLIDSVPDNVNIVTLRSQRALTSWLSLTKYVVRNKPDAVLATPVSTTIPAVWAKIISPVDFRLILRIPVVLSKTQFYNNPQDRTQRVLPNLINRFYPYTDRYVAISQGVANDLEDTFGVQNEKIDVIYNPAIDDELMQKKTKTVDHAFFNESQPVIVGAGRLTDQKDFPTLINAFEITLDQKDARLIILGEGEKRNQLEKLVEAKGLTEKVALPGFVDNPFPYMEQADVFVLSSAWEGFGNVIPEALACGTPVVSTDCESGPREILDNGKYGELVDVGDSEDLSKKIIKTIDCTVDEEKLINRAMDFHINNIVPKYQSILIDSQT